MLISVLLLYDSKLVNSSLPSTIFQCFFFFSSLKNLCSVLLLMKLPVASGDFWTALFKAV